MNPVVVSAFMTDVNHRNDRKIPKYIEYGHELIHVCAISATDIILFLEKQVFTEYYQSLGGDQWEFLYSTDISITHAYSETPTQYSCRVYKIGTCRCFIIYYEWTNMFLLSREENATEFNIKTSNPHKDTFRYMVVQCNKTEWMEIASSVYGMENADTSSTQFAWIDFGIYHMFPSKRIFQSNFFKFTQKIKNTNSVCFASCWNPFTPLPANLDLYKTVAWVFAGSVFYGNKQNIRQVAEKVREKCLEIIETRKTLMWEVNIWYMVFKENPDMFSFYYGDHNQTIFG